MRSSSSPVRRLLSALLLATLAGGGWAASSLDAAELGPRPAAWEGEEHANGCPRLHDHATCTLLQHQRWTPQVPRPLRLLSTVAAEPPRIDDVEPSGTRETRLLLARAPPRA